MLPVTGTRERTSPRLYLFKCPCGFERSLSKSCTCIDCVTFFQSYPKFASWPMHCCPECGRRFVVNKKQ